MATISSSAPRAPLCTFQGTTCILRFAAGPAVLSFPRGAQDEALMAPGSPQRLPQAPPGEGAHRPPGWR